MRVKLGLVSLLLVVAAAPVGAQRQIQLLASVVDPNGFATQTLEPSDVRVLEDGMEARVLKVEPVDKRVTLQLLLDNGVGLGPENLLHLRNGVRGLIEALPEGIETTIVTTAPQPRFLVRATTDRAALLAGVDRIAPDSGAGRFVESLNEATQRIEREDPNTAPIIISLGTTAGDADVRERDVERMMQRLQKRPTIVHVIMLSGGAGRSATGGSNQTQVGIAVTEYTQGRYENIAAGSRIATLLPELGSDVATAQAQQSRQYRLFVERPQGRSGDLGSVSLGAVGGRRVVRVVLEATED